MKLLSRDKFSIDTFVKIVLISFLFIGLIGFAEPYYHVMKAGLAQKLMDDAWQASKAKPGIDFKPWPWADTWPVFKLHLIKQNQYQAKVNLTFSQPVSNQSYLVLADASGESLAFGPGLMTRHIYPGDLGNSLIAAHRDTHFAYMESMTISDYIGVEFKDGTYIQFQIDQLSVIDSRVEVPLTDIDESRITLVTCYPFDRNITQTPLRLLLSGSLLNTLSTTI